MIGFALISSDLDNNDGAGDFFKGEPPMTA